MTLEPSATDRMTDKLLAIESWSFRLRREIRLRQVTPESARVAMARYCKEIQYRLDELKELAEKEDG